MIPEPAQDAKGMTELNRMQARKFATKVLRRSGPNCDLGTLAQMVLDLDATVCEMASQRVVVPLDLQGISAPIPIGRIHQPYIPKGAITVTCPVCGLKIVIPEKSTANNVRLIKNRHREASRSCAQVLSRQTRRKW